jgi:WD40 repeat protein
VGRFSIWSDFLWSRRKKQCSEKKEISMAKEVSMSREMSMNGRGGHLYIQTNEVRNCIIHYHRSANGTLTEAERVATGGAGSGTYKPISGQESAPNSFEGAASVILSPDRKFLFATNGGDNSVSSFAVGDKGRLTLIDTKPTGNDVEGKSGTAKSLAYSPSKNMLYVVHSFGPDHIRLMSVSSDGRLTPRMERYTANTPEKPHRVPTMGVLSPDEKFLLVGTTFDLPIAISGTYPDGSPILWVPGPDGKTRSVASNAPDPDGIVVFRVNANGTLSDPSFQDGGGGSPFYIAFLHNRPDSFIVAYAVGD